MTRIAVLPLALVAAAAACFRPGRGMLGVSSDAGRSPSAPPHDLADQVIERSADSTHPGYEVVPDWPALPVGAVVGEAVGVEVDSHNHVFLFHRADRVWGNQTPIDKPTVFSLDGDTGQLLAAWGENLFFVPHGLTVDHADNVWATDVGLNRIFKFTHDGKLLATIEAGFDMPTDLAIAKTGDIYVSDGYGNSRVARFGPSGALTGQWGAKGTEPGQFHLPHSIAFDGRVYVADRANARVQIFDASGALLDVWSGPRIGRPWGVAVGRNGHVFLIDGGDQIDAHPSGRAVELDHAGNVVTTWGSFGVAAGQFNCGHAISVGPDGSVYVVEQVGRRIQKFRPIKS